MAMAPATSKRYTIDDLDDFPDDGKLRELVDGQIVEWDVPNFYHSFFVAALSAILRGFVVRRRLGAVVGGEYMVRVQESRFDARGADVAFYRRQRIPKDKRTAASAGVPDLVVELFSPSDRAVDVQEKIRDWLRAGVRLLWYVDPETGLTVVYQGDRVTYVGADEVLTGGDVLPGFTMRMREVLDELAAFEVDEDQDDNADEPLDGDDSSAEA